ncbi:hypothetical protein VNO77_14509 [Canavalia gladiata]|uniref:Uncharacterized protein n=1 Tax=Canavalia gladiata TaxID=3824 RepID=A0AAN9LYW6_CANGL
MAIVLPNVGKDELFFLYVTDPSLNDHLNLRAGEPFTLITPCRYSKAPALPKTIWTYEFHINGLLCSSDANGKCLKPTSMVHSSKRPLGYFQNTYAPFQFERVSPSRAHAPITPSTIANWLATPGTSHDLHTGGVPFLSTSSKVPNRRVSLELSEQPILKVDGSMDNWEVINNDAWCTKSPYSALKLLLLK